MANANIDALYAGCLRIKIAYFVSEYFSFYKWCVNKVAHSNLKVIEHTRKISEYDQTMQQSQKN